MPPNRLFIDEILSVGLVAAGDNPDAEVVLFKSRDDKERREPSLDDYRQQLETIKKERRRDREVDKIQHRRKDNMPSNTPATDALIAHIEKDRARAQGEKVPDDLDEMVAKKLDAWSGRRQLENEIQGKYGSLSTPRVDQRVKIKALWWQSPDGQLLKELLRDGASAAEDSELIVKSFDSETAAAWSRLDE